MFHANTENYGDQENAHGLTKKKEKITKKSNKFEMHSFSSKRAGKPKKKCL